MTNSRSSSLPSLRRAGAPIADRCRPGRAISRRRDSAIVIVSGAWPLLQVGERVNGVAVPGEALDAVPNQRPAHRRGDRDEQLRSSIRAAAWRERVALCRDGRLAGRIHQRVGLGVAHGARRSGTGGRTRPARRRRDLVDQAKSAAAGSGARSTVKPERAPVGGSCSAAAGRAPGPSGRATRIVGLLGCRTSGRPGHEAPPRSASGARQPRRGDGRECRRDRVRARSRGRQDRERRARRSSRGRSPGSAGGALGVVEVAAGATGTRPNRPEAGSNCRLPRGSLTALA